MDPNSCLRDLSNSSECIFVRKNPIVGPMMLLFWIFVPGFFCLQAFFPLAGDFQLYLLVAHMATDSFSDILFRHLDPIIDFLIQGKEPEMTCVGDFGNLIGRPGIHTDTLDYVWFTQGSLKATGALRTPERSVLLKYTGLPSPLFPSDHLPVKAQFTVL